MADRLSKERRSWNMSRIRGKDTSPELAVRRYLHRKGFRYSLHRRDLPGRPDIVLSKYRTVVFVHGCFWHRHQGCQYSYYPKSRVAFWRKKFRSNVERDRRAMVQLGELGWKVLVVWECQTTNASDLGAALRSLLKRRLKASANRS